MLPPALRDAIALAHVSDDTSEIAERLASVDIEVAWTLRTALGDSKRAIARRARSGG